MNKKIKMLVLLVGVLATNKAQAMKPSRHMITQALYGGESTQKSSTPNQVASQNIVGSAQVQAMKPSRHMITQALYDGASKGNTNESFETSKKALHDQAEKIHNMAEDFVNDLPENMREIFNKEVLEDVDKTIKNVISKYKKQKEDAEKTKKNNPEEVKDNVSIDRQIVDVADIDKSGRFSWDNLAAGDDLLNLIKPSVDQIYNLKKIKNRTESQDDLLEVNLDALQDLINDKSDLLKLRASEEEDPLPFRNATDLYNNAINKLKKK